MTTDSRQGKHQGKLKVYLGAAPGVGKTYAMLEEAHSLLESGRDVVIGIAETHGRSGTARLLKDLPSIPPARVSYRGTDFEELDVSEVLARRPDIVLVDELAHTVVASDEVTAVRKRWQDVHQLTAAGIDVITAVNIQHLESLNDVVREITGQKQYETIPDAVLRNADEVELVDISPDALRIRLGRGQIYPAEVVDAALSRYFRIGNLTALRELALLWLADQVDEGLGRYRTDERITDPWPARERILVAVSGGSGAASLIRRGARIVGRTAGRELVAVHVIPEDGLRYPDATAIQQARTLTESFGGSWHVLTGDDVAATLLDFAHTINATQLVIGSSQAPWRHRVLGSGVGARVVDGAGEVDVHIVNVSDRSAQLPTRPRRSALTRARQLSGWVMAVALPTLLTALFLALGRDQISLSITFLSSVTAVVFVALVGGWWPALTAALLGTALINWFFTAPVQTLSIHQPDDVIALCLFVAVASAVARVVDRAARTGAQAQEARSQALLLSELAGSVIREGSDIPALLERITRTFEQEAVTFAARSCSAFPTMAAGSTAAPGVWEPLYAAGPPIRSPDEGDHVMRLDEDHRLILRGRALGASETRILDAYAGRILSLSIQHQLQESMMEARRLEAAAAVQTALLTAVSHDLRTPLAGITTAVSGLLMDDVRLGPQDQREMLQTIDDSAQRLDRIVGDLLDMSRIHTGSVTPHRRPWEVGTLVADALAGMDPHQQPRQLQTKLPEDLPWVLTDAGLVSRILENLLHNAAKYSSAPVWIDATQDGDEVILRIVDHGPGLPDQAWEKLFSPFTRWDDSSAVGGLGLGTAVARGLAEAVGAHLTAEETPGGGLTMVLALPAATVRTEEPQ